MCRRGIWHKILALFSLIHYIPFDHKEPYLNKIFCHTDISELRLYLYHHVCWSVAQPSVFCDVRLPCITVIYEYCFDMSTMLHTLSEYTVTTISILQANQAVKAFVLWVKRQFIISYCYEDN